MVGLVANFKKRHPGESWWVWLARQSRENWQPEITQYFDEQRRRSNHVGGSRRRRSERNKEMRRSRPSGIQSPGLHARDDVRRRAPEGIARRRLKP